MKRVVGVVAVPAAFAAAVTVLLLAGRGNLATPPVGDLERWAEEVGPIVAAVALLRLAALAAAAWMLVATVLASVAHGAGAHSLARAVDLALPAPLRAALGGIAGAGVVGVVAIGATGAASMGEASTPPAVEQLVRLPAGPGDPPATETMTVLPDEPPSLVPVAVPMSQPSAPTAEWTVESGDSFWSIAEDVLTDRLGRPPTEDEILPFWRSTIAANRDRLLIGDADLIYPGQVFVLPE